MHLIILSPIFLPDLINSIQQNIDYYENVGSEGHIRIAMYLTAINLILINFPFGSGLGSFGSLGSLIQEVNWPFEIIYGFSSVYYEQNIIGLAGVDEQGINDGTGTTFLDTYWPHIFGELGFIGAIPFIFLWLYPLRAGISILRKEHKNNYGISIGYLLVTICLIMSWEGFTLIQPEVPMFIFLEAVFLGLLYGSYKHYESKI